MMRRLLNRLWGRSAPSVDLDAFSSSQVASKLWLVERLEEVVSNLQTPEGGYRIWILGGWYGITNLLMRSRGVIPVDRVRSFDIDPVANDVADKINKFWEIQEWQFKAQTMDVDKLKYDYATPHIVINTSVEHMATNQWFMNIPKGTLVALQGNNLQHKEHTTSYESLAQFKRCWPLTECLYEGDITFNYPEYSFSRYMVIGFR